MPRRVTSMQLPDDTRLEILRIIIFFSFFFQFFAGEKVIQCVLLYIIYIRNVLHENANCIDYVLAIANDRFC